MLLTVVFDYVKNSLNIYIIKYKVFNINYPCVNFLYISLLR